MNHVNVYSNNQNQNKPVQPFISNQYKMWYIPLLNGILSYVNNLFGIFLLPKFFLYPEVSFFIESLAIIHYLACCHGKPEN